MGIAETHMKDSTGTWREILEIHMKDSGGTWRDIRTGWMKNSSGGWVKFFNNLLYNGTITIGTPGGSIYGYDSIAPFGSLSPTTYTDRSSTSRTIVGIVEDQSALPSPTTLKLGLSGTSVPNTDNTFAGIIVNDNTDFARSSATYNGSDSGNSTWTWSAAGVLSTSGTDPLRIY